MTFNGNGDIVHLHTASFESVKNLLPIKSVYSTTTTTTTTKVFQGKNADLVEIKNEDVIFVFFKYISV